LLIATGEHIIWIETPVGVCHLNQISTAFNLIAYDVLIFVFRY